MPFIWNMDYVNINTIVDRVKRQPLLEDVQFETILDYTMEFIKILGLPDSFIEKTEVIDIDEYKGLLPCDFYMMNQVRHKGRYFRYSTNTFHMSNCKNPGAGLTYKIQGRFIFTSLKKGPIEISYRAYPLDAEGMPLIPDDGCYARALVEYIIVEVYTNLFDQGKINGQALQNRQLRYADYAAQARANLLRPTMDQMEAISNMWGRLLQSKNYHQNGYTNLGSKEHIKNH